MFIVRHARNMYLDWQLERLCREYGTRPATVGTRKCREELESLRNNYAARLHAVVIAKHGDELLRKLTPPPGGKKVRVGICHLALGEVPLGKQYGLLVNTVQRPNGMSEASSADAPPELQLRITDSDESHRRVRIFPELGIDELNALIRLLEA